MQTHPGATLDAARPPFEGRYEISSILATGGMGVVYAATHIQLGTPVAIKVVRPGLTHLAEAQARFSREARAYAACRAPHNLRVYDAGNLGTDTCFIVSERLERLKLEDSIPTNGPIAVATALDYMLQAFGNPADIDERSDIWDLGLVAL